MQTIINAPIQACFDASRSIDMHMASVPKNSKERAISGVTSGLIGLNEQVEWKAKHFGFYFRMTVSLTEFESPVLFVDEQVKGPFKNMRHQHQFEDKGTYTLMKDTFTFEAPLSVLAKLVEVLVLKWYLRRLLIERNAYIKKHLEASYT